MVFVLKESPFTLIDLCIILITEENKYLNNFCTIKKNIILIQQNYNAWFGEVTNLFTVELKIVIH